MAAPQNVREFSSGLMDCFSDCSSCICGFFCLTCLACKVAGRLGENSCCVGCCLAPASWLAMRTKTRTMYGINGSICNDYCALWCCAPCVICQLDREMNHVGL
ncbi:placenta-specific gene 8 protein-like [Watersipora subatra]|uniref:placenta-specific gene 8 protein-like n=1 Tax=Watersipora subatra TaxID=2589382 RepID=UPI00355B3327